MGNPEIKQLSFLDAVRFARRIRSDAPLAFKNVHAQFGPTVGVNFPGLPIVSTMDSKLIDHILRNHPENYSKGSYGSDLSPLWGSTSLQLSDSNDWRRQRRVCAHSFASSQNEIYHQAVLKHSLVLVEKLNNAATEIEMPLYYEMRRVLMRALCDVWFGLILSNDEIEEISDVLRRSTDFASKRMLTFPKIPFRIPTPNNLQYQKLAKQVHQFVEQMMYRTEHGESAGNLISAIVAGIKSQTEKKVFFIEARNNLVMFLLAAYEFPSLGWTLYFLGKNAEFRKRIIRENRAVFGEKTPQSDKLPQLVDLQNAINESLRLAPPAPLIARKVLEDENIYGITVKKGWNLVIPVIALQHDERIWANPLNFDPDRFKEEVRENTFLPFGVGQRGCIGEKLTRQLKLVLLSVFFQHFDYTVSSDYSPPPHDKLKSFPREGVPVILKPRKMP